MNKAYGMLTYFYAHLEDWPRAAYYAGKMERQNPIRLAECYWRMNCKPMTNRILKKLKYDPTRQCELVKLYADMGNLKKALALAEQRARQTPDIAYLMAGYACRQCKQYNLAIEYYEKAAAATKGGRDLKQNKERALECIKATKNLKSAKVSLIPDGSYRGSAKGYQGPVEAEVTVKNGKITDVKVLKHRENKELESLTVIPARIVAKQGIVMVDAVSSATISSEAVMNAVANALAGR